MGFQLVATWVVVFSGFQIKPTSLPVGRVSRSTFSSSFMARNDRERPELNCGKTRETLNPIIGI